MSSRVVTHSLEFVPFENVEHLDQRHSAATRRRHADDVVSPIRAAYRCAFLRFVPSQVFFCDHTAAAAHLRCDQARSLTTIEPVATVLHDSPQGAREIRLAQRFTGGVGFSVSREGLAGRRILLVPFHQRGE